jgi:hypothetical protein
MRRGVSRKGKRIGVSAYRRIGVSAFAKRRQLVVNLLVIIAVPKSSLTRRGKGWSLRLPHHTPIRQPADPPTRFPLMAAAKIL